MARKAAVSSSIAPLPRMFSGFELINSTVTEPPSRAILTNRLSAELMWIRRQGAPAESAPCQECSLSLVQRDPDTEEPVTPTAVLPVEDWDDSKGVIGEWPEIALRVDHIARRPGPRTVPTTGRRRSVPATWRRRPEPGWRRVAGGRAVVPAEPSRRWRRRRPAAWDAEANGHINRAAYFRSAPRDVSAWRNVRRVRRLGARRIKSRALSWAGRRGGVCTRRRGLRTRRRGLRARLRGLCARRRGFRPRRLAAACRLRAL